MSDDDIRRRVLRLVATMAPTAGDRALTGSEHLVDDLGFDSVRMLELLMVIERAFELPAHRPEQLSDVRRADDVVALTERAVHSGVQL